MDRAFGRSPISALDVFRGLGEDLADAVRLLAPGESLEETLRLSDEVEPVIGAALAEGKGAIFVTAHLGPMERMAALVASKGYRVSTLARDSYDPRFTALYERVRGSRGVRTIYRGRPGFERSIIRRLREGYLVGFPMDLAGRGMTCGTFEFLGEQALLPLGPAVLALRTGAAVLVGTPVRATAGEMLVTVNRVDVPAGGSELELTQRLGIELEKRILALPEHWPWMHSRVSGS